MKRHRRIGLYGGTFDPVHLAHVEVAKGLSRLFALDEVLFIPAHVAPHKREARVTPALHRHAMLVLATQHEPTLKISPIELDSPERPYTFETLTRIRESIGKEVQLFFIMGADSWNDITSWREPERVLEASNHLVVTRPGYEWNADHVDKCIRERVVDVRGFDEAQIAREVDSSEDTRIYLTDAVNMDISATRIREAVRDGRIAEWGVSVAPAVADYIRKYKLYGEA